MRFFSLPWLLPVRVAVHIWVVVVSVVHPLVVVEFSEMVFNLHVIVFSLLVQHPPDLSPMV